MRADILKNKFMAQLVNSLDLPTKRKSMVDDFKLPDINDYKRTLLKKPYLQLDFLKEEENNKLKPKPQTAPLEQVPSGLH